MCPIGWPFGRIDFRMTPTSPAPRAACSLNETTVGKTFRKSARRGTAFCGCRLGAAP